MRIKIKIVILIVTTLALVLFVAAYYTQRAVERDQEGLLLEDAAKIVKEVESSIAAAGDGAERLRQRSVEEMEYLGSFHVLSEDAAKPSPDPDLSEAKRGRIRAGLGEGLEKLLYLSNHITRVDIVLFEQDGTLSPFFSKIKRQAAQTQLTLDYINQVKDGRPVVVQEAEDDFKYLSVLMPVRYGELIIGMAGVKASSEAVNTLLTSKKQTTLAVALIAVAIITGVLILSMNQMVNRPIQNLLSAISEVKEGNLRVAVASTANDELGLLSEHFNSMVDTIRRSSEEKEFLLKEINRQNDELQTGVREATEELLKRNEDLVLANQSIYDIQKKLGHSRRLAAVGQLAATVAHELGTPLHSVSGHLQLLMEEPGLAKDSLRRLTIMQSQVERIITSIQNILDTTRQPESRPGFVDLNEVIEDLSILVMPETISKGIRVTKTFAPDLPLVYGSRSKLEEVCLNLIDNAIDALPGAGAITITTRRVASPEGLILKTEGLRRVHWAEVAIEDNGRGIPEALLKDIFKPFYTTKAHGKGTGLGLAISQEIVAGYHGFLTVESEPQKGSVFRVLLPSLEKITV
ncbi:MAG: HAMP domain-containing protein [Deltaproteobacteria bacterium]|nr:HAMP domain-containing protein [Deltaproteobacteria bacterium]